MSDASKKRSKILTLSKTVCQVQEDRAQAKLARGEAMLGEIAQQMEHQVADLEAVHRQVHQVAEAGGMSAAMLSLLEGHRTCIQAQMHLLQGQKHAQAKLVGLAHQELQEARRETLKMERALERAALARRRERGRRERHEQEEHVLARGRGERTP